MAPAADVSGSTSPEIDAVPPPRTKPFRFKAKRQHHDDDDDGQQDALHDAHDRKRRRERTKTNGDRSHKHSHRRHRHHHHTRTNTHSDTGSDSPALDTDAAFRESLFDALADDEGAAYWEGVYGQPIHTYPQDHPNEQTGELERMTDEEYVEFVRARMWEKTHQHILEERARRAEARQRKLEEQARQQHAAAQMRHEDADFQRRMDQSLKAGKERKETKLWRDAWTRYNQRWEELHKLKDSKPDKLLDLPWPVRSGKRADVNKDGVVTFFKRAPPRNADAKKDLRTVLKTERVRWHPDKIQQRFSAAGLTETDTSTVTAVFQFIDELWSGTKT